MSKKKICLTDENDSAEKIQSSSIFYDDTDWEQQKEENGLCDINNKQCYGGSYVSVENMNEKTTAVLKTIAKPRTKKAVKYSYKPDKERWFAESILWDVNEDIALKYGVKIEIEQGSLYYRGSWLKIIVNDPNNKLNNLKKTAEQFSKDYGFASKKQLNILTGYELPWTEDQKKRQEEDDNVDFFFDSMDDED